jgi:penicillin amidase
LTENGKPILSCDPHLGKAILSTWYPMRIAWKEPSGERAYMSGGSVVSLPFFSYGSTKYMSFGVTSLNPDLKDLYSEQIKDGKYLYDG